MRALITILAILLGLAVAAAVYYSGGEPATDDGTDVATSTQQRADDAEPDDDPSTLQQPADPADDPSTDTPDRPEPQAPQEPTDPVTEPVVNGGDEPASPADTTTQPTPPTQTPTGKLTAQTPDQITPAVIGSNDPAGPFKLRAELSAYGAAIKRVTATDYATKVEGGAPYPVIVPLTDANTGGSTTVYAFAAWQLAIDGLSINLLDKPFELVSKQPHSATYALTLLDPDDQPIARVVRTYRLGDALYDIQVDQHVENLTGRPINITWRQLAQGDMQNDGAAYLGDKRRIAIGYFDLGYDRSPNGQPLRRFVYTDNTILDRYSVIGGLAEGTEQIWPRSSAAEQAEFVWIATTNRYFAVAIHPPVLENDQTRRIKPWFQEGVGNYARLGTYVFGRKGDERGVDGRILLFTLTSRPLTIAPRDQADLDFSVFAGPRDGDVLKEQPYKVLSFPDLIVYNLGGMCAVCTFQWLAHGLLAFLEFLHDYVVFDWGVAIILLVVFVRLILHPITKKSQVNMMKMGKQMAALQPEVEKLKKKYKDDQSTLNTEMMKLYREKGVNPANMLGCAPMFLQMPIWIALYAMLYYAIELRHEAAFYGVFQFVSGGGWAFFQDLSQPDNFIQVFEQPIKLNLYFIHPNFQSINIIPILMAVVFYFQQKLMTPPAASEQAAQQQKMMKFMVFLFPVFLYSAPSGLTLYIMSSTAAGIVDSYIVRQHVKQQEESGELFKKKERKPGGFMDRLSKAAEQRQQEMLEKRKKVENTAPPKKRKKR